MRKDVRSRYYKVFTYQSVDRVPDVEFGYWPQTIRRWLKEGMAVELSPQEQNECFPKKLDAFLGFDPPQSQVLWLRTNMIPPFEEKVIEKREHSTIIRDSSGCLAERFANDQEESSIPHFIEFPVKTPRDWEQLKMERYRLDDPQRDHRPEDLAAARQAVADGRMIDLWCPGPYGMLRWWMGFENVSLAFYEYPDMIHDMVEHMTEMCVRLIREVPADIPLDHSGWWEDMAGKNGPFVSPKMFREFLQPQYHRIQQEIRKRSCVLGIVDCDGNPHDLVGNWLEEGVNIMFPLEQTAGVDLYAWRREFGRDLRLKGGIAKAPLIEGGGAIDRELDRIRPLLEQGGFIPHLDHLVPPNVSYANYRQYLDKKRKMIGKA